MSNAADLARKPMHEIEANSTLSINLNIRLGFIEVSDTVLILNVIRCS